MEKQVYTWINGGEGWWAFAYKYNAKGPCGGSPRVGRLSFCNHHNKASVRQESSVDTKCRGNCDGQDISMVVKCLPRDCSLAAREGKK